MAKTERTVSFEDLYSRLEDSVAKLEQGGLTLDQAIELYEQGMRLAKQCQDRLDAAELKITKLKESFAVLPRNQESAPDEDELEDYEYVVEEDSGDPVIDPADEAFP